jgi:hypothetical protein
MMMKRWMMSKMSAVVIVEHLERHWQGDVYCWLQLLEMEASIDELVELAVEPVGPV